MQLYMGEDIASDHFILSDKPHPKHEQGFPLNSLSVRISDRLYYKAIEKTGGEIDYENFYWCEVYTHKRYCEPRNRGEKVTIDYIMPVKEKINNHRHAL